MIAADLVALLHTFFISFVVWGVVRGYLRPWLNWILFACGIALIAQMLVSHIFDTPCIFTFLEVKLRPASNGLREDGFVVFYLREFGIPFNETLTEILRVLFAVGAMFRARSICCADLRVRLLRVH